MIHRIISGMPSTLVMLTLSLLSLRPTFAQPISPVDAQRIESCRAAIHACQLSDGAIATVGYPTAGSPVYIEPYFANLACLGLLDAHAFRPAAKDLKLVRRWLQWLAESVHVDADRTNPVFTGTRGVDGQFVLVHKLAPDSHDSYAATYLSLAAAYVQLGQLPLDSDVQLACERSLDVLVRCHDPNGFFWSFDPQGTPMGKVPAQYLLDNIEVHQGLAAAHKLFHGLGDTNRASMAERMRTTLEDKLHEFWKSEGKCFVCMYADKLNPSGAEHQPLPIRRLAAVSALGCFTGVPREIGETVWARLISDDQGSLLEHLKTVDFSAEEPSIERVYLASRPFASMTQRESLLNALRQRVDASLERNNRLKSPDLVYKDSLSKRSYPQVHRFGMMIQGLLAQQKREARFLPHVPVRFP